jgi:hypothetical protein
VRLDREGKSEHLLIANVTLETSPLGAAPAQAFAVEATPEVPERVEIELAKQFDEASTAP